MPESQILILPFLVCLPGRMWSVVLRGNSVRTCQGHCTRWLAGWWRRWSTARSPCLATSRGGHLRFKMHFLFMDVSWTQLNMFDSCSAVTLGPSASPAPTKHPQASSIHWREASSTSTSRPFTCVLRRSPASTLLEAPPRHAPSILRSRPSRGTSTPSAASRGEDSNTDV